MTESDIKRLMKLRKAMQSKKPSFRRIESWRYKRVHGGWRAAKGIDSATRQKCNNGIKSPNVGYRTPKKVRGLHPSGLFEVFVSNIKDLDGIDRKKQGITIDSKLGIRKRQKIIEEAQLRRIRILNLGIAYDEKLRLKEMGLFTPELTEEKASESEEKSKKEVRTKEKKERKKESIKLEEDPLEKLDEEKVDPPEESPKKTAKKSTKKTTKKSRKKSTKKSRKKSTRKSTKKSTKKASKKTSK